MKIGLTDRLFSKKLQELFEICECVIPMRKAGSKSEKGLEKCGR